MTINRKSDVKFDEFFSDRCWSQNADVREEQVDQLKNKASPNPYSLSTQSFCENQTFTNMRSSVVDERMNLGEILFCGQS